jgi:hypothetical protein
MWLHTFLCGYTHFYVITHIFVWLHTFLYDYTHFYVITHIYIWLHTFLYGYTHFCMVTHIFVWLHTFLDGYIHLYIVMYIYILLCTFLYDYTFLYAYIHFYFYTYIFILLHTFLYGYIHVYLVIWIFIQLYAFFGCNKKCHGKSWQQISGSIHHCHTRKHLTMVKWPQATGAVVDSERICTRYAWLRKNLTKLVLDWRCIQENHWCDLAYIISGWNITISFTPVLLLWIIVRFFSLF